MGLSGLEPPTSRLSGVRSNRLSYKPLLLNFHQDSSFARFHQVLCGNTIISLRSMRCTIFLNSNFALLVLIKKCFGNTIASLRYARCTFSLRFKLRFARFHQVFCGNTIISFHSIRCACFLTSDFALLVFAKKTMWRHPPTLPYRLQYSTIGRPGLNHRVRNGNGCLPRPHRHR